MELGKGFHHFDPTDACCNGSLVHRFPQCVSQKQYEYLQESLVSNRTDVDLTHPDWSSAQIIVPRKELGSRINHNSAAFMLPSRNGNFASLPHTTRVQVVASKIQTSKRR